MIQRGIRFTMSEEQFDRIDYYLDIIIGLGTDYDGFNSAESLKILIDELVEYASIARRILHDKEYTE